MGAWLGVDPSLFPSISSFPHTPGDPIGEGDVSRSKKESKTRGPWGGRRRRGNAELCSVDPPVHHQVLDSTDRIHFFFYFLRNHLNRDQSGFTISLNFCFDSRFRFRRERPTDACIPPQSHPTISQPDTRIPPNEPLAHSRSQKCRVESS